MALALFVAFGLIAVYGIVFFFSWQGENCFAKLLFEYISPIVGSALTLLGVALTIRANGKTNEMALERNEKNAELIQRRDKQPFIRCNLVERSLEGELEETRKYDVRVRLFGNNSDRRLPRCYYRFIFGYLCNILKRIAFCPMSRADRFDFDRDAQ